MTAPLRYRNRPSGRITGGSNPTPVRSTWRLDTRVVSDFATPGTDPEGRQRQFKPSSSRREIAGSNVTALDPDRQLAAARETSGTKEPSVDAITRAARNLLADAVRPLATSPDLRERLVELRRVHEQAIDETSADEVLEPGYSAEAADRARSTVEWCERFCDDKRGKRSPAAKGSPGARSHAHARKDSAVPTTRPGERVPEPVSVTLYNDAARGVVEHPESCGVVSGERGKSRVSGGANVQQGQRESVAARLRTER